jgi:hypothetical protein
VTSPDPWTFEDFVLDPEPTWTVYDENLGRIVAIFYDRYEAESYLKWRNKKQAKKRAERAETVIDYDGMC